MPARVVWAPAFRPGANVIRIVRSEHAVVLAPNAVICAAGASAA